MSIKDFFFKSSTSNFQAELEEEASKSKQTDAEVKLSTQTCGTSGHRILPPGCRLGSLSRGYNHLFSLPAGRMLGEQASGRKSRLSMNPDAVRKRQQRKKKKPKPPRARRVDEPTTPAEEQRTVRR